MLAACPTTVAKTLRKPTKSTLIERRPLLAFKPSPRSFVVPLVNTEAFGSLGFSRRVETQPLFKLLLPLLLPRSQKR